MIPTHFPWMVWAELRKVYTRGSGVGAIVIAAVVGLGAVGIMYEAGHNDTAQINGATLADIVKLNAVECSGWALSARNFFVLPLFLLLAASSSVAGELGERTLREDLVRPIPRWSALASRMIATSSLAGVTLLITGALSFLPALLLFGLPAADAVPVDYPTVGRLALGYLAAFASDVGLIAIAMLLSLMVQSVGGVVVTLVLILMADLAVRGVLNLMNMASIAIAAQLLPWTLGNALGCWQGWSSAFEPMRFLALGIVTAVATGMAMVRLSRMDVP
ncbi:MAG: hypothetical protein EXR69_01230 [Myxococcales bacterium]|nr:hypothetical protein [Myxococcales bacterium]